MPSVREAIAQRRSIRKYRIDDVSEDTLRQLRDAARLAPSGSNSQPWRFKVVRDAAMRARLAEAANGQGFVREAPVVLACCVDLGRYIEDSLETVREMVTSRALSSPMAASMLSRMEALRTRSREELAASAALNIGIAGEHIALTAVELGLGTCWVKAFDESKVRGILGLDEDRYVVALMPVGYPAESPSPRRRKSLDEIVLP